MLQLTPQMTLYLAVKPADFRKGIDTLAALCKRQLQQDPFSGAVFVFANRRRNAVKILAYDGSGFWLCQKRFSKGQLHWWPRPRDTPQPIYTIDSTQLTILLNQGHPLSVTRDAPWRPITPHCRPSTQ